MSKMAMKLNDGNPIPWLAFGTGTSLSRSDVSTPVELALEHGFVHIDTAALYGNEEHVGAGLEAYLAALASPGTGAAPRTRTRDDLYVTTKLNAAIPEGESVRSLLVTSLGKLKLGYVDLYLIHTPQNFFAAGGLEGVWAAMEEVKREGLARSIGVSNFRVRDLERILKSGSIVPAVNQIEFHPYVYKWARPLLELHAKHGIVTMAYRGLTPLTIDSGDGPGPVIPVLETIQARLQSMRADGKPVSLGQICLKWLWHHGAIVVTTSKKESRLDEYVDIANLPDLTPEEVKAVDEAGSTMHVRAYPIHKHMDRDDI